MRSSVACLIMLSLVLVCRTQGRANTEPASVEPDVGAAIVTPLGGPKATHKTLMLYSYYEGDENTNYKEPLEFFVETAVMQEDNVDYVIIINDNPRCRVTVAFPKFSNLHTVCRNNTGRDPCAFHDVLENIESLTAVRNISSYERIIFSSGTTLGPLMLPPWWHGPTHWTELITAKLSDQVKLAGVTISCQVYPHVQSYLYATDQVGLSIIRPSQQCYENKAEDIYKYEVGMSKAIIGKGFNIASLMHQFQGWDFREERNHKCNDLRNPTVKGAYFGTSLKPSESKFFKITGGHKLGLGISLTNVEGRGEKKIVAPVDQKKHDFYDWEMETMAVDMKRVIMDSLMQQHFDELKKEERTMISQTTSGNPKPSS